ncbi:hypothetical protein JS528_07865 [Bifidobacterium sp. MA2]|uniref:CTP synthase n=1 Tax=Bifidobacterium santillanense TaxID=2809028 RepID=A0ABS5UR14_9BIFI|nr:hypothetical protein [Bifidobacterium santillanense]MBT1173266.1 hypothetical protein [Bifidobacterium santillanense]
MKQHREINELIRTAQSERRCAFGATHAQRQALSRRAHALELQQPMPNLYADATYWRSITPPERTLHIARTLTLKHPDWTFGGLTAAAAHGFEHRWGLHDGTVTVLTATRGSATGTGRHVTRLHAAPGQTAVVVQGIPVTTPARTVVDCGLTLDFRDALAVADSALAGGLAVADILAVCSRLRRDCVPVFQLLRYANPASENGGESLSRGTMIEQGFMVPEVQVTFVDPSTGRTYRADFVWRLPDGRIIVGELDGTEKYVNPEMTDRRSIQGVVLAEREREAALRRARVTTIFRFTFDDVIRRNPLVGKLLAAGVPRNLR